MAGFADVLNSIDAATDAGNTKQAIPRVYITSKPSFSNVLDAIDSGGNSAPPTHEKVARNIGAGESFGRGVASGVTANFYDELRGLHEAGGASQDEPMSVYSVLRGALRKATGDQEAARRYDIAAEREREANKQAEEQHPVASTLGNVGGALALPVGGAAGGATLAARAGRAAAVGAGYGALSGAGEGENAVDRATRATTGAALGGAVGAAGAPLVEGAIQGARVLSAPIVGAVRGAINPENEAARRVVNVIQRDIQADPAARNRLTPQEFMAARQNGAPVALIDLGGEATKALGRSAANTSPEGRQVLNDVINDRFEGQTGRVTDWLRRTFNYPDANSQSSALQQAAKGVNQANYRRALQEGNREIVTPEMERLMTSPTVVEAMRRASTSGKDRAVTQGLGGFNAGVTVENGGVNFRRGPNGVPTYPNLQFWDAVKRELDDMANSAGRAGERDRAGVIGDLARSLRGELDQQVPSYAGARQGAAHFFGAENALEAGQNFVTSKMANAEARQALAKMSPTERQLFQDGFVSRYVESLNETGDRRSVLNKIAQSPAARERLNIALGPQRATELEAGLRAEGIMDLARKALQGNSTTARQLVELGLAGGSAGYGGIGAYNMDPKQMTYAAIAGALVAGRHHVDVRLARRVAEMLASDDPQILQRGIKVVASNNRLMQGLRSLDRRLAAAGSEQVPSGLIAGGMAASHADENQPRR